jgi:hypothetical protein
VSGRLGQAVAAVGAALLCVTVWGALSLLDDGRLRSILIVPLAVIFFWGLAVLLRGVVGVIFGHRAEKWTRLGMFVVGVCAAMFGVLLIGIASWHDGGGPVDRTLQVVASFGFWVSATALLGAIAGELPEIGMAEGD